MDAEYVAEIVAQATPLTAEQRARVAAILRAIPSQRVSKHL
jgi:hypothetical protein